MSVGRRRDRGHRIASSIPYTLCESRAGTRPLGWELGEGRALWCSADDFLSMPGVRNGLATPAFLPGQFEDGEVHGVRSMMPTLLRLVGFIFLVTVSASRRGWV